MDSWTYNYYASALPKLLLIRFSYSWLTGSSTSFLYIEKAIKIGRTTTRAVLFNLFSYGAPLKMFWRTHAHYLLTRSRAPQLFAPMFVSTLA